MTTLGPYTPTSTKDLDDTIYDLEREGHVLSARASELRKQVIDLEVRADRVLRIATYLRHKAIK